MWRLLGVAPVLVMEELRPSEVRSLSTEFVCSSAGLGTGWVRAWWARRGSPQGVRVDTLEF